MPQGIARKRAAFILEPGGNLHDTAAEGAGIPASQLRTILAVLQAFFIYRLRYAIICIEHFGGQNPLHLLIRYPVFVPAAFT